MKHRLVLSLGAVVVAAMVSSVALADVDVALNLRYTDPNDTTAGGDWQLVAFSGDATDGIAGISAYLSGAGTSADFTTAWPWANGGTIVPATFDVQDSADFSGTLNLVAGVDLSLGATSGDTGTAVGGSNGYQPLDPLRGWEPYTAWDGAALIATGSFTGSRPAFVDGSPGAADTTAANLFDDTYIPPASPAVAGTIGLKNVRGDSMSVDGLLGGDANRDWKVDILDFGKFQPNKDVPGVWGWDDGDWNSSTTVDILDFGIFQPNDGNFATPPAVSVAVSAVPEPSTAVLAVLMGLTVATGLRRKR